MWPVTPRGRLTRSQRKTPSRPQRPPRPTARDRRARCAKRRFRSTAGLATPGNVWPTSICAALSSRARSSVGWPSTWSGSWRITASGAAMDFGDAPEEAAFRVRLREWLEENNPKLPTSSTDDDYWAGQRAWHQALYDGGFFGTTWPEEIGGQGLPSVYDVIVDEELAAAGAPPRPSLGYLVEGILEHGSADSRQRFLPGIVNGRDRWCQGFSEPDAGSDLASLRTRAEREGRRVRPDRSQGLDELLRRRRVVSRAGSDRPGSRQAQGHFSLRRADASAGHSAAASAHDQRDHQGVR